MLNKIKKLFKRKRNKITHLIHETWDDIEDEIVEKAFSTVSKIAHKTMQLNKHAQHIHINIHCIFGVSFLVENSWQNLHNLGYFSKHPPKNNNDVLEYIKRLRPEIITFSCSAGFKLGFHIGGSIEVQYSFDDFVNNFDKIVQKDLNYFYEH